jgi:hypothetical protein
MDNIYYSLGMKIYDKDDNLLVNRDEAFNIVSIGDGCVNIAIYNKDEDIYRTVLRIEKMSYKQFKFITGRKSYRDN